MCNVTALAMALFQLGIENPSTQMQYEDYLDAEIEADEELLKSRGEGYSDHARQNAYVLMELAKRKLGLDAKLITYDIEQNTEDDEDAKDYFDANFKDKSAGYLLSSNVGGGGHYVTYLSHNRHGVYINDPYGQADREQVRWAGYNNITKYKQVYGHNNFYTWKLVRERKIAIYKRAIKISKKK